MTPSSSRIHSYRGSYRYSVNPTRTKRSATVLACTTHACLMVQSGQLMSNRTATPPECNDIKTCASPAGNASSKSRTGGDGTTTSAKGEPSPKSSHHLPRSTCCHSWTRSFRKVKTYGRCSCWFLRPMNHTFTLTPFLPGANDPNTRNPSAGCSSGLVLCMSVILSPKSSSNSEVAGPPRPEKASALEAKLSDNGTSNIESTPDSTVHQLSLLKGEPLREPSVTILPPTHQRSLGHGVEARVFTADDSSSTEASM